MFTLKDLLYTDCTPAPYETGDEFWDDPYIATRLLPFHLSPDTDAASYRPETMRAICDYLPRAMNLAPGAAVIDLGCGPGLYCGELAGKGYRMTGVDRSENSLRYAREHTPDARFIRQSYLEAFGENEYDGAMMISQDIGVLSPADKKTLLHYMHRALKPGACFAFDVPSLHALAVRQEKYKPNWFTDDKGFYRPHPHFVVEKSSFFPEEAASCDSITVFDHEIKTYRFWQTFYSPDTITQELAACGFATLRVEDGLTGKPYRDDAMALGVVCRKI